MKRFFLAWFTSMYLLYLATGVVTVLGGAATKTVGGDELGGVEMGVDATGTVAIDTSEDADESTGYRGSNLPLKGRVITEVGSTSAVSLVEVECSVPGWRAAAWC